MAESNILRFVDEERITFEFEGRVYELNNPDDLSLEQQADLNPCWRSVFAWLEAANTEDGMTPELVTKTKLALDKGVRALVRDCPPDVIDRISDNKRMRLVTHFLEASGLLDRALTLTAAVTRPTGAKSSPSSRQRTAATRKAG